MKTALSKHRIEALSDGLFAIVMTLLVLDVRVPELPGPSADARVLAALRAVLPTLGIFAITFLLTAGFWFQHHLSMHPIRSLTRTLVWINLVCLMLVSLLPFSASLLMHNVQSAAAAMVYYGNILAVGLSLAVHWTAARRLKLVDENTDPAMIRRLNQRIWFMPAGAAGAIVGGAFAPVFSSLGFGAGILAVRLISRVRGKRSDAPAEIAAGADAAH
jgi:uncharacterized membrane protein